jgi:uncharacterized protein YbjT (DUF2867 family)
MAKSTLAIMGATGHIGYYLVEELLKKGRKVRAIGRNPHKLQELKAKGAEIHSGDLTDVEFLAKGFHGCQAIFSLIPPGLEEDDMEVFREKSAEAIDRAIVKAKITHVVNLSSIGANVDARTGPIKELHRHEERLDMIPDLNVLHVRPGFFMENLSMFLPVIKKTGSVALSIKKDLPIPMVATRDIALKVAELMSALKFTGSSVFELAGPREVTMTEAAQILGKAMGKPDLKYVQLSYEQAEKAMIEGGMKHQVAKLLVEMHQAFNEGKIAPTQKLTAEHRGKTTLEEFCKELVLSFRPGKKAA